MLSRSEISLSLCKQCQNGWSWLVDSRDLSVEKIMSVLRELWAINNCRRQPTRKIREFSTKSILLSSCTKHNSAKLLPLWKAVMRVYVYVAIFIRGVSFCFAVRLGGKNCDGLDTNNRDPLCTPPYKAYTIPNGALRHNVALLKNEDRVDDKENEARGTQTLKKLRTLLKSLSGDKMSEIHRILNRKFVENTADVERNNIFKRSPQTDIILHDAAAENPGLTLDEIVKWSDNLEKVMKSQDPADVIPRVVILLEHFRAKPEFQLLAEDLERLLISNPEHKFLVFANWIKNYNTLRNTLRIFVGVKTTIDFRNPQYQLWLEYANYIIRLYVRYAKSDNVPSSIFPSRNRLSYEVKSMHNQQEIFTKILQEGEAALAHLVHTRWAQYLEEFLSKAVPPELAFKSVKDYQQAASDDIELISLLNYVIRYRINHDYPDTKLYNLLTSERSLDELVDQLRSIPNLPRPYLVAAGRMLYSMITDKGVSEALARAKNLYYEDYQWLVDLNALYAESGPTEVMTFQELISTTLKNEDIVNAMTAESGTSKVTTFQELMSTTPKNKDVSNGMTAESEPTKVTTFQELISTTPKNEDVLNAMTAKSGPTKVTTFQELMSTKPNIKDITRSKLNAHPSIYEHGTTPVASTDKQQKPQHLAIWILATCRLRDKYRILTPAI
ncbi:hypothetical protein Plhal304r1_c031g0101681 [Plasmopara halstedii]